MEAQTGMVAGAAIDVPQRCVRRRAFAAIGIVLLTFAAFWPTTLSLMTNWEDTEVERTYTHGYVVLLLAFWLIWRDRKSWAAGALQPWLPGAAVLAVGAVCWLVAYRAGLQIVHQAAIPALAATAMVTVFGWQVLRSLAFPLAWLYLAIPVWDVFLPLLNWISVLAVRFLLRIADVPAFFVDNTFQLPLGTFEIADGCSGLHFFVVALTVSLLYGEINRDTLRTRVKLVAFALLLAMATNWLRIFIIVLAGHLTDMQHRLVTNEHYSFGWYMFAGMMMLYFLVVRRWPAASLPERELPPPEGEIVPRRASLYAVCGLLLAPLWLLADANRASDADISRSMLAEARFETAATAASDWQPKFSGATRELHGVFHDGEVPVELFVAGYASQRQGEELTGYRSSLLGERLRRAPDAAAAPAPWKNIAALGANNDRWVIWSAYRLDDRWYRSALRLQIEYGVRSLWSAPAGAVIALRARCGVNGCDAARESLKLVIETHYP